ncbi:helix-turn-helix domain-containing protein [Evansella sp. LMS18]|uniref:helix-turn-helix domain-containing protein n=1 Tax=Evansella sp. LMS18 TaxID=2924033 RepID=UPI0020CFF5D6|nr:helix-turn-helix domain-containing protein [Evansella sp. LMS18]UTR08884.1 helix-turn-helix domain-containing protein [Evansella sp. LMS18]
MHIGSRLKRLRKNKGIGQSKICEGLVSPSHYSNIESGRYEASPEVLKKISQKLEVPENYLLGIESHSEEIAALLEDYHHLLRTDQLTEATDFHEKKAEQLKYIPSIKQETEYLLLRSLHAIKNADVHEGRLYFDEVLYYVTKKNFRYLPNKIKFIYYYIGGLLNFYERNYKESIHMYRQALRKAENESDEGKILYNTALTYMKVNEVRKALNNTLKAKDIYSRSGSHEKMIHAHLLLGIIYLDLSEFTNAKIEFNNGLKLTKEHNYEEETAKILHNLGIIYFKTGDYDTALGHFFKSLEKKDEINSVEKFITYYSILAIYAEKADVDNIQKYLPQAQSEAETSHEYYRLKSIEADMELFNGNKNKYEQLKETSLNYFYENEHWLDIENEAKKLSKYFFDLRKYKKAYQYLEMENQALEYLYKDRA